MHPRIRRAILLASVCVATLMVACGSARSGTSAGVSARSAASPDPQSAMTAQAPYMKINEDVPAALGRSVTKLAGTRLDVAGHRFYVYLAGRPTPGLLGLKDRAAAQGIDLVIKHASFSSRQLGAAVPRVVAVLPRGSANPGYGIELAADGSGLTIDYSGAILPDGVIRRVKSLSRSTGIPIKIRTNQPTFYPA